MNVLFVCLETAGRSQMAEALFTFLADGRHAGRSAGTAPAERVHPETVWAMADLGLDLSRRIPRKLGEADVAWADVIVTMGCGDSCPVLPGKRHIDWNLDDPAGKGLMVTRRIRDEIGLRVIDLLLELDRPCSEAGQTERRSYATSILGTA